MRRLFFVAIAALFLSIALVPSQPSAAAVTEGERLAMFSKPSVVRIIDGVAGEFYYAPPNWKSGKTYSVSYIGLGSGFFVNANGYIVTNAHVVSTHHEINQKGQDLAQEILFYQLLQQVARDYNMDPKNLSRENVTFVRNYSRLTGMKLFHHVIIPDGSVYEFEEKQYGAPTGQGKDVAILKIEVKNAPVLLVGDSEKMNLQDHVSVIGYPGAADTFNSGILDSKSSLEASITDGKVSARKKSASGAPILQISAPATHGNSGGPVITDAMEVIGLLTFGGDRVNGQEISGFDFVVPSSTVMEFIKAAGVANEQSHADKAYREGLELYWDDHYSSAIPKFEEVKRLFPEHSEVNRLIQGSQQAIAEGKDKSGIPSWTIVAIILVVLFLLIAVILIGVVAFIIVRRRGKGKAAKGGPGPLSSSPSPRGPASGPSPATPAPPSAPATPSSSAPPAPAPASASPSPFPAAAPQPPADVDRSATVDLSRTVAIIPQSDTAEINYGKINFVSGALAGQSFPVTADGACIGRDGSSSQIVIADPRISKRHVWVGVRGGRVVIEDQSSRNGTFLNDPKSERITENALSDGDTVILGESDVARFEYRK
ncbi:MAG TPA: trypsin-like peptidase domain-containing protein [Pyrinomonadaceae bacterium]|nr:trypsin-like peptidase domain-containing protein [Pyrinomonadaceae bacterium]